MRDKKWLRNVSADDKNEDNHRKMPELNENNNHTSADYNNNDGYDEDKLEDDETNLIEFANLAIKLNSIIVTFNYRIGIYGRLQVTI